MLNYYAQPVRPPLDPVFHALADGTRRHLVARLAEGPATVGELAAPLPISLPAVLQHLKVLQAAGLVESRKAGRIRTCALTPAPLLAAGDWIAGRRAFWEAALGRLETHLSEEPADKPATKEDP